MHLEARYNRLDRLFLEVPCFKFNAYGQKRHSQATTSVKPLTIIRFVLNLYVCACSCHEKHSLETGHHFHKTHSVFFNCFTNLHHLTSPDLGP